MSELLRNMVVVDEDSLLPSASPQVSRTSKILHAVGQRIPGVILIAIWTLVFIGPPLMPTLYWSVVMLVHVFLVTNAVRMAVGLVITAIKTKKYINTDWNRKYVEFAQKQKLEELPVRSDMIKHVIVVPNYKEDMATLCDTLDTLAHHEHACLNYKVILAMEEGEAGCMEKATRLVALFGHRFYQIVVTVHPSGIPGEARGKSSNVAWATQTYAHKHMLADEAPFELITVMDADTHLSQKYFECITFKYCTSTANVQSRMLFAPTLVFDRNANQVPFVVRMADMCWTIGLMANFQLPVKLPCSVYTVTMLLAQSVDFWDAGPEAIGEDVHMALKCWTHTKMTLQLTPIYIPASCSNVQADTWLGSVNARFQQSLRHLWGSLDFGYTAARLITEGCWRESFGRSMLVTYLLFEIFFQPYFGFFHLTGQFLYTSSTTGIGSVVIEFTTYIRLALVPFAAVVLFAYERYHYLACIYRVSILETVSRHRLSQDNLSRLESGETEQVHMEDFKTQVAFRAWYRVFDWVGFLFALVVYYMITGINAMMRQLFTNKLDYKVSLKPTARPVDERFPVNAEIRCVPMVDLARKIVKSRDSGVDSLSSSSSLEDLSAVSVSV